jgi:hypothetical protein
MSVTTTQGIDAKGYLASWLGALVDMTSKDIRAIPADKWKATFGGCTRAADEVMADTIWMLEWCTGALKGQAETTPDEVGSISALKDELVDSEAAVARLTAAANAFSEALRAASDDALNEVVTPPWQMPAPLFMLANIAVSHVWYHDGQLNYIQALLGDDKIHWMEQ